MIKLFTTTFESLRLNPHKLIQACVFGVLIFTSGYGHAQTPQPYKWNSVAIGGGGFVTGIITSKEQPGLMYARTDVGGAYRWDIPNSRWIPLTDWASDQQQGMFGVESIAIDPTSPNIVYMACGISYFNSGRSYVLRSIDYGANFTVVEVTSQFKMHGNGLGRQNGEKLQVDPNNGSILYYGTRRNGLFKSTDSGASWLPVGNIPASVTVTTNDNGISFVLLDKSSVSGGVTKRIFAGISRSGNDQNFFKSEDGGATFTAVINTQLLAGFMPQRAVFTGDGNICITYANGAGPGGNDAIGEPMNQGQIWKYNISTGAWTNISPNLNKAFAGISVDPANPQRMVASTTNTYMLQRGSTYGDRFFITTNGGTTWTDIIGTRGYDLDTDGITWVAASSIHWAGSIEFDPSNTNKVLVVSGNGIFMNENINTSNLWKFHVKGLEETVPLNLLSIPGGPVLSVIGDYGGFRHTDVSQYSPRHNPALGSSQGLDFAALNTNKIVRAGYDQNSTYYSNDMGLTWTKAGTTTGTEAQVALSADGNVIMQSAGSLTSRTVDNGTTWTSVTLPIDKARPVSDRVNSNKFYAFNPVTGNLHVSTNGGVSFTVAANPGTSGNNAKLLRTVPGREGHIWIPLEGRGLSYSENSGVSFTNLANVSYCAAVGIGKSAPGSTYETIYIYGTVGGIVGIYRSTDKGVSWLRVNDDDHEYGGPANGKFVIGDMNVFGRVYMSTAGRGIIYGEPPSNRVLTLNTIPFSINENAAPGTNVGTITATPNEVNLHNWSIVAGNTNNVFSINANTGVLTVSPGAVLDKETKSTYSLEIAVLDNLNKEATGFITININDINEAPNNIELSKSFVVQNNTIGSVVASILTTDADANSTFTYALVSGTGSVDNAAFTISGSELKAAIVFNFTTKPTYAIRIRATDNTGLSFEKAFTINVNKVAVLPVTNFTVKAFNEVCAANNDGKITITAAEPLTYQATISGNTTPFTFTNTLEIPSLVAGTYTVCITAEGIADYQKCYELTIAEPQPLSVYSSVNLSDRNLVLNLSGGSSYQIELNGKTINTTSNSVTLNLNSGANSLKVSTGKECQGVFSKSFFLEDGKRVYPNPFDNMLNVSMGNDPTKKVLVDLYSLTGALAYSKEIVAEDYLLQLDLSALNSGTYIMKIKTGLGQSSSKIIKK
ncbi:MAG: cadherin domain-containing protein [Sphingobacteriaceae bacterium]|nr:cadherin domain-containing protein [Sphingobacteriaceae bacterium]